MHLNSYDYLFLHNTYTKILYVYSILAPYKKIEYKAFQTYLMLSTTPSLGAP